MAFIDYVSFENASPELQALYIKYGGPNKVTACFNYVNRLADALGVELETGS